MEMYDNFLHSLCLFYRSPRAKESGVPLELHHISSLNYVPHPLEKLLGHPAFENVLLSLQKNILCDSYSQISDWVVRNKPDECF